MTQYLISTRDAIMTTQTISNMYVGSRLQQGGNNSCVEDPDRPSRHHREIPLQLEVAGRIVTLILDRQ